MFAVRVRKLCFHKLCRRVGPGDTDLLSGRGDSFKDKIKDFVKAFPVGSAVLHENVIVDIVLDDLPVNLYRALSCRFLSLPFWRLCRFVLPR